MAAATSPELAPLVTILSREHTVYQDLLEVASEERAAIVRRELPALKKVLQRKQDILGRLAALEDRRISWLRRYARRHDLDLSTVTLASIVTVCHGPDRHALTRLQRGLQQRIEQVVAVNRVTSQLLGGILKSIDGSLRFLLADDGAGQTYGSQGRLQDTLTASRQLLECRA